MEGTKLFARESQFPAVDQLIVLAEKRSAPPDSTLEPHDPRERAGIEERRAQLGVRDALPESSGLELGILSSRPLWANPINPVMFLLTGLISGMAFVVLLWIALDGRVEAPRAPGEKTILTSFALPALLAFFLGLNAVFYVSLAYSVPEVVEAVGVLATGELAPLFLWVGLGLGALVPAVFLAANAVLRSPRRWVATLASALILIGAFAQKYGFVVGGQVLAEGGGEVPSSLWPTSSEIIEFLSILALAYFLFQVALSISPWRTPKPAEREAAPPPEVTA